MTDLKDELEHHELVLVPLGSRGDLQTIDQLYMGVQATRARARYGLFLFSFVLPVALAVLYLFFVAADRYESEIKFIVRSAKVSEENGERSKGGPMSFGHMGSRISEDAYVVSEYITSRNALDWLIKNEKLDSVFSRREADMFNRFPNFFSSNTRENFYSYYKRMVSSQVDEETGINTIAVEAFSADDARRIAAGLIRSAEELVNKLNERQADDAIRLAQNVVDETRVRMGHVEARLRAYREKSKFVDPSGEVTSAFTTITQMSTELAQTEAAISRLRALTPESPSIDNLIKTAQSYKAEIARRKQALAGKDDSIAARLGEYDQIVLEQSIASKAVMTAETDLQSIRTQVRQQGLYLAKVTEPNSPDQPTYPRRKLYLALTVLVCSVVFVILKTLRQFADEHAV